jgi:hypothetical protein
MTNESKSKVVSLRFIYEIFLRLITIIRQNIFLLLAVGLLSFITSFILIKRQAPTYKATYLLSVKGGEDEGLMGVMVNLVSRLGLVGSQVQEGFNNRLVTDLLNSNSTLKTVLRAKGSSSTFSKESMFYYWLKSENRLNKYPEKYILQKADYSDDAMSDSILNLELSVFKSKCLKVNNDPLNGYLSIEVNTSSRLLSVELCNDFAQYVREYYRINFKKKLLEQRSSLLTKRDSILREMNSIYFQKANLGDRRLNAVTQTATADIQLLRAQLIFMQKIYEEYTINIELLDNKISIADDVFLVIDSPNYSVAIVPKHALKNSCLIAILFVVLCVYGILFVRSIKSIRSKIISERIKDGGNKG